MPDARHHPSLPLLMLLALLLSLLTLPARAALVLHDDSQPVALLGQVDYLTDPSGALQLQALLASPERFHSSAGRRDLGFGYVQGAIWLRLQVESAASQPRDWRLEIDYPSLDRVDLYDAGADGVRHSQAGDMLPFAERSVGNRNPVFDLHLQPGERRTLYLRASSAGSMTLGASLYSRQAHELHSIQGYVVQALYGGTLLALGCYNLLLFLALRERPFFYYVLFVSVFAIGILGLNGIGAQFLWPQAGWWTNRALPFGINGAAAIGILFARSFLDTPKWLPRGDRWLRLAFVVVACCALATLLLPVQLALQIMSISGIAMCLTLLGTGFVCLKNRVPGAGIFALAWSMLLGGAVLLALRNFALIPSNFFTIHAMQIGSSLEMILLSFALAARFNVLKRQKEQALQQHERQLELRVAERTEALEDANQRLRGLAMKDPLTGLANRTALQTQLELAIRRSQRRQELLAVMLIDLDGFKPINDQHGHALGDQVLAAIARRLQHCARETDLPARLGGDEFVLVCETISSPQHAEQVAQRILEQISLPIELDQLTVQVGASIGIALSRGEDSGTLLIRRADAAMYAAKASGRNRVQLHEVTPA
ncbi:GGDEF domain-containing protein [Aquipseudomonas campi]|uniref:GGDEF domain-containing protein n=1 Tax=Aquipseudomonas campi TaxID=2731681 RepID=A0A6M8FLR0_9GAMM|nr:diguanylate cyclase [Pseudomonas campi]QKE64829.1 GGDEF domain-containing protein [Pseudomonas campi]